MAAGEDLTESVDEFVTCLPDHGRQKRKFLQHEDNGKSYSDLALAHCQKFEGYLPFVQVASLQR